MAFAIDLVRERFPGREIEYFECIDSTMREAALRPVGSVVVADEQTAGIGRQGHAWHSEKGSGLYVSTVLAPSSPVLTLALGLAVSEALAREADLKCDLRWPNDVMCRERKLAGVLVQLLEGSTVAGIGINVNHQAFDGELSRSATSVRIETGRRHSRERLLIGLLETIESFSQMLFAGGAAPVIDQFTRSSSYARGKRVIVEQSGETHTGVTAGLDPSGFLILRRDDGAHIRILAGGVRPVL
jgi:BirA family biotin operon repressor/biotin-[acetyl-CoA-carboxylase] ligase